MQLGARPELRWLDKKLLCVEADYQRELSQKRSQQLINKLAEGWSWVHCSVLIVAAVGDAWTILDGQHRHQAALRRDDIRDLPCLIVDASTSEERARAFVAHNRDRVALNFLALFHADVAAGVPLAKTVVSVCKELGISIPRTPKSTGNLAPNETMAVGALTIIQRTHGRLFLIRILRALLEAYPTMPGQLRSNTLKAAATVHNIGVGAHVISKALAATNGNELENAARNMRGGGLSLLQCFAEVLAKACGTTTIVPKKARGSREAVVAVKPQPVTLPRAAVPPPKPSIVESRGNTQPRRLEAGTMMELTLHTLKDAGVKVERGTGSLPYRMDGKKVTFEVMIAKADQIRAGKGLPRLRKVAS